MRGVWLVVFLLAGCSAAKEAAEPTQADDVAPLSGFVFDAAIAPLVGATVSVPALGVEVATDTQGRYVFSELPYDQVLTVIVQQDGFKPSSKSMQLVQGTAMRLNFTLEKVPEKVPTSNVLTFKGVINCNGVLKAQGDRRDIPCGMVTSGLGVDERIWDFRVEQELAGLVVEVVWDHQHEFAKHLNLTIETVGYGDQDKVIYSAEGESILRGQVGVFDAHRFYSSGGQVRVTVDIGRNTADEEVDVGVGMAVQQSFEVFASAFYVAPPPPSYSIDEPG